MVASAIALSDVRIVRREAAVLERVTLDVAAGEKVCLIGASGSGKTSLLRVIVGLDRPAGGRVVVHGVPVTGTRRDVTMVFQDDTVYEHLDVSGNLDFPFRVTENIPGRAAEVAAAADRFSIRRLLPLRPATLSSGQRRVVSAARALVRPDVSVALLDEPLVGTDPHRRARLVAEVMSRPELTVVLSTNEPTDALRWTDQVVALDGGTVAQCGPPHQLHDRPVSLAVADLLGEMNRIPASVSDAGGDWTLEVHGSRLSVERVPRGLTQGQRVVVGVRPSDLVPASRGMPFHRRLRVTVGRVELVGATQRVLFGLGDRSGVGFVAELDARTVIRSGDRLDWYVAPSAIRLFEPRTGRAIDHD